MADYFPLISGAIARLPADTPEARRDIYQRARAALENQLRALTPPISEADIARERLSLDEAIGKLEAERLRAVKPQISAQSSQSLPINQNSQPPKSVPQTDQKTLKQPQSTPSIVDPKTPQAEGAQKAAVQQPPVAQAAPLHETFAPIVPALKPAPYHKPNVQNADSVAHIQNKHQDKFPIISQSHPTETNKSPEIIDQKHKSVSAQAGVSDIQLDKPRLMMPEPVKDQSKNKRAILIGSVLGCVILGIAGLAVTLRSRPAVSPQLEAAQTPAQPVKENKISERVGEGGQVEPMGQSQSGSPQNNPDTQAALPIAQRVLFYEERADNPQASRSSTGRAIWRLDLVNSAQGQRAETIIRSDIDLSSVGLMLTMIVRRNQDSSIPASHLVQLSFTRTGESTKDDTRIVREAGIPQFKGEEDARGQPLVGLLVPVSENVFLVGLSNVAADITRNTENMLKQSWIDIPIRFANGRRAVVAIEKGFVGEKVFKDAFTTWK
jgi:hypothetical protein